MKNPIKYAYLLEKVYRGETVECPECGASGLTHTFFADTIDRIGFAQFRCDVCGAEAHLSRVKFPKSVEFENMRQ